MSDVTMTAIELQKLLEEASEKGARRALERLGLHDDTAPGDMKELRSVLEAYRTAKSTAFRAVVHWLTVGFIALLVAGFYANMTSGK